MATKENSKEVTPHPDVLAWNEWKRSPEGVGTCDGTAQGVYLENRLWRAFMAGRESFQSELADAIEKARR